MKLAASLVLYNSNNWVNVNRSKMTFVASIERGSRQPFRMA